MRIFWGLPGVGAPRVGASTASPDGNSGHSRSIRPSQWFNVSFTQLCHGQEESSCAVRHVISTRFLIQLEFLCQLVTPVESHDKFILARFVAKGAILVVEKSGDSNMKFVSECEIMNRLVSTTHRWDDAINRADNKIWVMDVHDELQCCAPTVVAMGEPLLQFGWKNPFFGQLMMRLVRMEFETICMVKWKINISSIFMETNNKSPGVRAHSGFINWRNTDSMKRAMFLQLGAEHVPILNILFLHFWKLDRPSLLLFFGAWLQVDFES